MIIIASGRAISQELKISSSGVKERILMLVRMGLLKRDRVDREETYPITTFTISSQGKKVLAPYGDREEK